MYCRQFKIVAYHDDSLCEGATLPLELLDLRQVLMPRQWFLKKLDPKGELSVPDLLDLLRQHMLEYRALVLLDHVEPGMTVKKALAIYRKWHGMNRQPTWGAVPFSCSCKVCFAHCICRALPPCSIWRCGYQLIRSRQRSRPKLGKQLLRERPGASGAGSKRSARAPRRPSIPRSST